jgi:pimeloyl-ACP methyl ester carboxylesterase
VRPDIDPARFPVHRYLHPSGLGQAYVRENIGGVPLVLVHGWPETKRIWWKVIAPLAEAGFEVIVPDLRGFGDSDVSPDGFHDVAAHAHDLWQLVEGHLGHHSVVLAGGDLGGPIVQHLALEHPEWVDRMVLFNSPLPYLKDTMSSLEGTRPPRESSDYFVRQGLDADGLAAELSSESQRRHYIATFYTSRYWAHPGAFTGAQCDAGRFGATDEVDFHTEPFADAMHLRASFGAYESTFDPARRSGAARLGRNDTTPTLLLYGPSDRVIYPAFDQMAAQVFARHVGPFLLRDCGHFVPWEAPHAFVSGTESFCSDLLRV